MNNFGSNLLSPATLSRTSLIKKAKTKPNPKPAMETVKARGLVLREYEAGESDKRLLLLCKDHGRMMIYARGARKPKSKFMAAAQLFTYSDFVLTKGRGFYALAQAQVIESFYGLRTDYDCLAGAHLVVEVCEKTLLEDIACDDLLLLALKSLNHLSKNALPSLQVIGVFLMRFYAYYGLTPDVDACTVCGEDVDAGAFFCAEGLVCKQHKPGYSAKLSQTGIFALRYILGSDLAAAFMFNAREDVIQELWAAARMLWRCHFDWKLASEAFV